MYIDRESIRICVRTYTHTHNVLVRQLAGQQELGGGIRSWVLHMQVMDIMDFFH